MPITRLGYSGYGIRRAGDFSQKGVLEHPVGKLTRLGYAGYGIRRAGSFANKAAQSTHPVGVILRLGEAGYGVRRYDTFAGKTQTAEPVAAAKSSFVYRRFTHLRAKKRSVA